MEIMLYRVSEDFTEHQYISATYSIDGLYDDLHFFAENSKCYFQIYSGGANYHMDEWEDAIKYSFNKNIKQALNAKARSLKWIFINIDLDEHYEMKTIEQWIEVKPQRDNRRKKEIELLILSDITDENEG